MTVRLFRGSNLSLAGNEPCEKIYSVPFSMISVCSVRKDEVLNSLLIPQRRRGVKEELKSRSDCIRKPFYKSYTSTTALSDKDKLSMLWFLILLCPVRMPDNV
jgi:hypothetical protein